MITIGNDYIIGLCKLVTHNHYRNFFADILRGGDVMISKAKGGDHNKLSFELSNGARIRRFEKSILSYNLLSA